MATNDRETSLPRTGLQFLGAITLVLFACVLIATAVRLIVGWQHGWWSIVWTTAGTAFGVSLLIYLGAGGAETIRRDRDVGSDRMLVNSSKIGRVGITLLSLALAGNFAAAIWDSAPVLDIVRDIIDGSLILCIIAYLVVRYREHRRMT